MTDDEFRSSIAAAPAAHPGRGRNGAVNAVRIQQAPDPGAVSVALPRDRKPPPGAKPLLALAPDECRWPYGHGPFLHCAAPFARTKATPALRCYCDYHELVRTHGSAAADALWAARIDQSSPPGAPRNGKASINQNRRGAPPARSQD